jgi:hypothetical protein
MTDYAPERGQFTTDYPVALTEHAYLKTSLDTLMIWDQVDGSALNTNVWTPATTTQTISQTAAGYIVLNASAIRTINTSAQIKSVKSVPLYADEPISVRFNAFCAAVPQANAVVEVGVGSATGQAAPTDGVFFRWDSDGTFRGVMNNAGVETKTDALPVQPTNECELYEIVIVEDLVQFYADDALLATLEVPIGNNFPTNAGRQPVFARTANLGTQPVTAPVLNIGQVIVTQQGLNQNKLWKETLVSIGRGSYQSPVTPFAATANAANSAAPASATLSNTTAGYTTLGGQFQFAALAGAATDYALFAYQVPAGFQLFVASVAVSLVNTGAASGAVETFEWGVGTNSTAVSLATVDGTGTTAPRRVPLGFQALPTAAPIGAQPVDLARVFDPPIIVDGGRYFHVILTHTLGAATGSEVFRGVVTVNGYFE